MFQCVSRRCIDRSEYGNLAKRIEINLIPKKKKMFRNKLRALEHPTPDALDCNGKKNQ